MVIMRGRVGRALVVVALLVLGAAPPSSGADPGTAAASPAIEVSKEAATPTALTAEDLGRLPAISVSVSFGTEHGQRQAAFEGPLLWTVLDHAGAIDAGTPTGQVRQTILITGNDGYTATIALGEIAPEFEGKQVILAERMDGQPLAPGHFRIVVPGDKRGGRSVRDVARLSVLAAPTAPR